MIVRNERGIENGRAGETERKRGRGREERGNTQIAQRAKPESVINTEEQ